MYYIMHNKDTFHSFRYKYCTSWYMNGGMSMKAYVLVYTGEGKGKRRSAIGPAIRAIGAGKRFYFSQFLEAQSV